jgi:hypothetical protein
MAEETLAEFLGVDRFYDYRGVVSASDDAPPIWLPVHQGDVFEGLAIPGVPEPTDGETSKVLIFMHPCVMRRGAPLVEYVTAFRVRRESRKVVDYERYASHFSVMPLPDLAATGAGLHFAEFQMVGVVPGSELDRARRIASLSREGRLLLQQRVVHHFTRHAPPLSDLAKRVTGVERELELQAAWCERACDHHGESADVVAEAEVEFDDYMSSDNRRDRLKDDTVTHEVTAEVNREIAGRYPPKKTAPERS